MLYLLDSGVLITASNLYYPVDRVPEFWAWLRHVGENGNVKVPAEIYEEIKDGRDDDLLLAWIKGEESKRALLFEEEADVGHVRQVIARGYANDLTDDEVEELGKDPFLIAYALADAANRCIVTTEVSKPRRRRQNRHVPDVCDVLGVQWCDTFAFTRALNFTTSWRVGGE